LPRWTGAPCACTARSGESLILQEWTMKKALAVALVLTVVAASHAAISYFPIPPTTVRTDPLVGPGPYPLDLTDADPSGVFADVTTVPGTPDCGPITFSIPMSHRKIGLGWATWSAGSPATWDTSVYYTNGALSVTIGLPALTKGFAFFAEPNPFGLWEITATDQDGTPHVQTIEGFAGAAGFSFYGTGATTLSSVTVSSTVDFAVGEFYITCVPEPASLGLLALGALAVLRRR
jgi:hypothetical protein